MNRSALKKYAPQARLDFIEAVTQRARRLGLDPVQPANIEQTGDVLLIGGQPFPVSITKQRATLAQRIQQQGFSIVIEALAYTWFNRLVAIRFMELKGYFNHGYRVLSHPQGQQPEILDNVQHLDLFGLDKAEVLRLKTAGNKDEELYREILLAQCHELHRNMPFLFEALDDATELLLPDNLLRTDSPIARLVNDIEENDWEEVEVIGWIYQFYISEKKDEVIGKVVKSEDIPAATQLFTPNWIVQYLVQNSLGRLWLMANPGSSLKEKMPYYIEPAEQTPEVQAQLDALIKVRIDEDGSTLNPESLTVLDPACGSGHILVEAYNLLRAIYEERGYRLRDIPRLILQKNLYGLDIDDRAAQLAGFVLLMKAREDDRRLFDEADNPPHLNVMAIQESAGLPHEEIAQTIISAAIQIEGGDAFKSGQLFGGGQLETQHSSGIMVSDLRQLIHLFENGKTFGSLISVPEFLTAKLAKIVGVLASVRREGDDLSKSYAGQVLEQFAWPASLLALQYDAVVANPPYMGGKGMSTELKAFSKKQFPDSKSDLFAMFMERGFLWCKSTGINSMVTMQVWMFLGGYRGLRAKIIDEKLIGSLVQIGYNSFPELNSKIAQACAFVILNSSVSNAVSRFVDLNSCEASTDKGELFLVHRSSLTYDRCSGGFKHMPGAPIAFRMSERERMSFSDNPLNGELCETSNGVQTGDNALFVREWFEVSQEKIGLKWFPYNKGGPYKKWFGNGGNLVDWESDGVNIKARSNSCFRGEESYFKPCLTWTDVTWRLSGRYLPSGYISDAAGPCAYFYNDDDMYYALGIMNTPLADEWSKLINPTLHFQAGDFKKIPLAASYKRSRVKELVLSAIDITEKDLLEHEVSLGFTFNPLIVGGGLIEGVFEDYLNEVEKRVLDLKLIESENLLALIESFGLVDRNVPVIKDEWITLECNPAYIFGGDVGFQDFRVRANLSVELVSYMIGCMMGRYSLDEPSLIYAHSGNIGFDPSRYRKFSADADGIIPISDDHWFEDDAAERVGEFVKLVWGADTFVENMEWLSDSLGRKAGETADEAIRRYLSTSFYKNHLQMYKKRPIYWLFSSGKQKAFECLVYLHRYNEGTLSRMRMEYVVPLQSRMQARVDKLADDINSATSSAQQKSLQKRKDKLTKQHEELRRFDEMLRSYADQRITLDLDDGVKFNYGKFGDLLAEVKAITGGKED